MKKHSQDFSLDIHRLKLDSANRRGLSADAIDELERWCNSFILVVRDVLMDAMHKEGIELPRRITIKGVIEISDQ